MSTDLTPMEVDEIKAEAKEKYKNLTDWEGNYIGNRYEQGYIEGVTAERQRAKVLVEALQSIIEKREHRSSDIYDIATTSINTYNKPQP